jgi:sugar O-acyltransferase (sialic acid O-acetyltransferase NeuD family)
MRPLLIFGAGGHARELAWMLEWRSDETSLGGMSRLTDVRAGIPDQKPWSVVGFISDVESEQGRTLHDRPVISLNEARVHWSGAAVAVGVAAPTGREAIANRVSRAGFTTPAIAHPAVHWSRSNYCGEGCVLQVGAIVTVDVQLGRFVLLNGALTVGHDCRIGDFTVVNPGATVSGRVHVGRRVIIGAGATVREGTRYQPLSIGDDAVIGAGACVVGPVEPGTTVVGVPARRLGSGGRREP